MRLLLSARFNMGATPARRALLAVWASSPFFLLFLVAHGWALHTPDVRAALDAPVMWWLQGALLIALIANTAAGLYLWPRRDQPQAVPRATLLVCLAIAVGYTALTIAAGIFTSGMGLVLLGALAIGLLLFELRPVLTAYVGSVLALVTHDAGVQLGWWAYAPALRAQAFVDGQPAGWLDAWRQLVFFTSFTVLICLLLLAFDSLDRLIRRLSYLSNTDSLTGLANRRRFMEVLHREVARQGRTGHPLCLVLIDADHFKQVNDTHGHHAGDAVLRMLGKLMMACVRSPIDLASRLGGEEFALILPDTALEQGMAACTRLREQLAAQHFRDGGTAFRVTVSMGLVQGRGQSVEALLRLADEQLYRAKAAGRDRICHAEATSGGAP